MAGSAPLGFDQRIAAQQAEAMHTRTRLMEIRRDGSDGRHDIRAAIADRQNNLPDVAGVERFVEGRRSNVDLTEKEVARLRSDLAAQQKRGEPGTETQEQLEEELATLARNKGELADAENRLSGARARFQEASDEINELKAQDHQLLTQWKTAESELDKYEDQNALLLKAQAKFAEADRTGDPATAVAARALLDQADAIAVDREAVRMEVSQFAEIAPTDLDEVENNFDPVPPFVPGVLPDGDDPVPPFVPGVDIDPDVVADPTGPDSADDDAPAAPDAEPAAGADVVDLGDLDDPGVVGDESSGGMTTLQEPTALEEPSATTFPDDPGVDQGVPDSDPLSLEEPQLDDAPAYDAPVVEEPAYEQPTEPEPTYEQPSYEEPADSYLE